MRRRRTVRERWERERMVAAFYDAVVERERLARVGGFALWGCDTRELFAAISELREQPAGTRVLDVPCGGGVALRALDPDGGVEVVAADLSAAMLRRTERVVGDRGLGARVRVEPADIEALDFADDSFDRVQSFNGLHCLSDPTAALSELRRVLRPGGTLRMTSVVRGVGARRDLQIDLLRRAGVFGLVGTVEDLRSWLGHAGFVDIDLRASGAMALVTARGASAAPARPAPVV